MIKTKSYDLKSILILSLFNVVLIIFALMEYLSKDNAFSFAHIILLGIFIFLCLLQIIVYFISLRKIIINYDGVFVLNKSFTKLIPWNEIKLYSYYNEAIILKPNTLKIIYKKDNDEKILLGQNYSNIHISLKKYKKTIKFIPKNILENNKTFLYRSLYLYEKDRYNLYENS